MQTNTNAIFVNMDIKIEPSWKERLKDEFDQPYFINLTEFVKSEYGTQKIYPPGKLIFNAFEKCPFYNTKVVILGQDPYHGPGQAHGLCFSVPDGISLPLSLQNIFKEIQDDLGIPLPKSGNLERWSEQGVFLLNATLTVRAHEAGSHQKKGWETFTDKVISLLSDSQEHLVFLLWGAYAQRKGELINPNRHLILRSVHPSPLSAHRGFFGNHQFSKTNEYLKTHGKTPVNW
jgi:uracil-DNA glycosylase